MNFIDNSKQLVYLRGIAAILVVCSHVVRVMENNFFISSESFFYSFLTFFDLGSFGVLLFFTLSGCSLYLSVNDTRFNKKHDFLSFYLKRIFRVYPPFLVALCLYILVRYFIEGLLTTMPENWISEQFTTQFNAGDILKYLLFVFNFTGPQYYFNNAFWSLPVEFQYYLIFPIAFIFIFRFGPLSILILSALLYVIGRVIVDCIDDNRVFTHAFSFLGGMVLGHIYRSRRLELSPLLSSFFIIFIYFFLHGVRLGVFDTLPLPSPSIVYGVVSIFLVAIFLYTKFSIRNSLSCVLEFYGNISYSVYLYHNLVLGCLVALLVQNPTYHISQLAYIFPVVSFIVVTIISMFGYFLIEKPSIKCGRVLINKL